MAKFRVYNVQLLPVNAGIREVGKSGYKRLFSKFQAKNKDVIRNRKEGDYHFRQNEDTFIGPVSDFSFPAGYVYGNFVRYRKVEQVKQLGTDKRLFTAGAKTGVTSEEKIAFVFDVDQHLLALEAPAWMPPSQVFADAIHHMLLEVAEQEFPEHELTVNGISKRSELAKVFATATSYSVVDLDLTFRNGHDTEELLQELKDTQTKSLVVRASAGKGGRMSRLPKFVQSMLVAAATGLGNAKITYFADQVIGKKTVSRQHTYDTRDMPVTFQVNRTQAATESDEEYFFRVREKLDRVNEDLEEDISNG